MTTTLPPELADQLAPTTTVKLPASVNARLTEAGKKTGLKKSKLFRYCLDVGLPRLQPGTVAAPAIQMDQRQLAEVKELFRSGVTDFVPGLEKLEGADFVAAVEQLLPRLKLKANDEARVRRFVAIYGQLFD